MVRTIQQIERDIESLDAAVEAIAQDFHAAYESYLKLLSTSVRKQLILAAYHLCTQGYPESFLRLSVSQRQQLQEDLKRLAQNAQQDLMALLDPESLACREAALRLSASADEAGDHAAQEQAFLKALQLTEAGESEEIVIVQVGPEAEGEAEAEEDAHHSEAAKPEPPSAASETTADAANEALTAPPFTPLAQLVQWREQVEAGILTVLQTLSLAANHLLYQAGILPQKLPAQVIEAATKAAVASEMTSSSPNLLNLMVEAKNETSNQVEVTRILAIRLRLSELEFGDMMLTTGRSKLRGLSSRLNQLQRDYQKRRREWAIAQAELAWRSTWFDES